MELLTIAQTTYYFLASLGIIVIGVLGIVFGYYLIKITAHVNRLSEQLETASQEVAEKIHDLIDTFSHIPFLSLFIKKVKKRKVKKDGEEA